MAKGAPSLPSLLLLALSLPLLCTRAFVSNARFTPFLPKNGSNSSKMSSSSAAAASAPFCIVVEAEIVPERVDEFLGLIEKDAVGSRAEPGCLRFDVLRSHDDPHKFFFYEMYKDTDAVQFHKKQPHFALWTNFKESGGVVRSVSHKADGIFL
eukprot:CAMPEP_0194283162 /NCGR_PEP_ID=MMETSP0169-20130528/24772_1 /TAXON_ID=218684 /ORGANISM="Corethron pennatum, Strain L29A3" /LENGTH=152 /DNA_ID=CAMNT_0039028701 /DNA_START=75 /DNA_END=533 /DNA_ORIENTATION=-